MPWLLYNTRVMTDRTGKQAENEFLRSVVQDCRLAGNPWFRESRDMHQSMSLPKRCKEPNNLHESIQQILEQRSQIERRRQVHALSLDPRAYRKDPRQES